MTSFDVSLGLLKWDSNLFHKTHLDGFVRSLTSTRDKTKLQYISGCNPHLTSKFCGVELGLKCLTWYHSQVRGYPSELSWTFGFTRVRGCVGSPTSTRDKTNSRYIIGCNPYFTNRFFEEWLK